MGKATKFILEELAKRAKGGDALAKQGIDDFSYRGEHRAPMKEEGSAPLHDLTGGGTVYPDDIYSAQGLQYYGTGMDRADRESMNIIQQTKGDPNAMVTMYRAVPAGDTPPSKQLSSLEKQMNAYQRRGKSPAGEELSGSDWYDDAWDRRAALEGMEDPAVEKIGMNAGDWVTLSRDYAKVHGESALGGNYKIITKKVPARQLYTQGDSLNEFGYDPSVKKGMAGIGALGAGTTAALYTPEQNKAMAGELVGMGVEDVGSITADEYPQLESIADFLDKYVQTPLDPLMGSPLEGVSGYLRDFGRKDRTTGERLGSAYGAALDILP